MTYNAMKCLPQDQIGMATNLKGMIIRFYQLQTTWSKGDQGPFGTHPHALGMFDIVHLKEGDTFVARAIFNPVSGSSYKNEATILEEGRSEVCIVDALKDLQKKVP